MNRILLVPLLLAAGLGSARADATLVFNEIMYHPATNEPEMEWVELYNQLAVDLDVSGWSLTGDTPAALVDWNNNYAGDDDKCVLFHCGNWAKSFLPNIKISTAPILGSTLGVENTYGALDGRTPAGPLTYGRITTADAEGKIRCYVGEGELTNDELKTFGNRAVAKVLNLQNVLRHVCERGFEHHGVMTQSHSAAILAEAFANSLGWDVQQSGK